MKRQYDFEYIKNYCDTTDIVTRNDFRDDVYIVVIGHLKYVDELIYFYKGLKNIIFVIDHDVPTDKVNSLVANNFVVIKSERPQNTGFGNINAQCASTMAGAEYLRSIGKTHMIRMRSDQIILQLHTFINNFKFDKISFLTYINNTTPNYTEGFKTLNTVFDSLEHVNSDDTNLSYNYVTDYCITGPVEDIIMMFGYNEDYIEAPGEHKLLLTYLAKKKLPLDNSYDFIDKHFYLSLRCMFEHDVDFIMFKQNYTNWTVCLKEDAPNLYRF